MSRLPQNIAFSRDICGELDQAEQREWLVTNGTGSFAAGTIAGTLTRRYHGWLIAALHPPGERTLLVSKAEEKADYLGQTFHLSTNHRWNKRGQPAGYTNIERFYLDGTTPVWEYALADARLEKRIWMQPGEDTTFIRYHLLRAASPLKLKAKLLINYRDMHGETDHGALHFDVKPVENGLQASCTEGHTDFYLLSSTAKVRTTKRWHNRYFMSREADRGLPELDDHFSAGVFEWHLQPGEYVTLVLSRHAVPVTLDGRNAFEMRRDYETALLQRVEFNPLGPAFHPSLVLAADQFIVDRNISGETEGKTVIAGYHWFSDWGRDTMIALPGLTLATGRPEIAATILRTFSRFISRGMLPNRFPEAGEKPEYNTVDAALWYFEAVRAYFEETKDLAFLQMLYPALCDMVRAHESGTRFNIHVDPKDGLLYAGVEGKQITWMDVKIGDWVVTPRIGKPVEINALWFNALMSMADFAKRLGEPDTTWREMAQRVRKSFDRFWNPLSGHCFDVVDGPGGSDASLRPNQLFAVSLFHSPLPPDRQKAVVDVCTRELLTSHGLRSLGPSETAYSGRFGGGPAERDSVYHQGTVWGWLIGPFVQAHLRVYGDADTAQSFLMPLHEQVRTHCVGSLSEIFEGDAPHRPRGAVAQAWTVAEWLRAWALTQAYR